MAQWLKGPTQEWQNGSTVNQMILKIFSLCAFVPLRLYAIFSAKRLIPERALEWCIVALICSAMRRRVNRRSRHHNKRDRAIQNYSENFRFNI
jgi:hypothetical protein